MPPPSRPIVFLSDFGLSNEWVGVCHAVLNRIAPDSHIVDISHLVLPLDVASGASLLEDCLPYVAKDAVILAIVDPGVGKDREIAVETVDGRVLVGPDNGLLAPAWKSLGGVKRAVEITSPDVVVEPVAPSFRARDVLCPAAAHLASGVSFEHLGPAFDPSTLTQLELPEPETHAGKLRSVVVEFNRFGNVKLNVRERHLAAAGLAESPQLRVEAAAGSTDARRGSTYADFAPGEYGVIFDPRGWLMVVRGNPDSALQGLGLATGDPVWISSST
jgi:S-adenosyl-L-methionine hydrolase (adenosine-forming)